MIYKIEIENYASIYDYIYFVIKKLDFVCFQLLHRYLCEKIIYNMIHVVINVIEKKNNKLVFD